MPLQAQSANNCLTGTGLGKFDLQLVPNANLLNVGIKLFFVEGRAVNAQVPNVNAFFTAMRNRVTAGWDNKLVLRAGTDNITVRFNVTQVMNQGSAHFSVVLLNGAYGVGSGLKFATGTSDPCGVGVGNVYLELQSRDNEEYYVGGAGALQTGVINPNRMGVLLDAQTQVVQAAPGGVASFDVNMTKAGGIWTVDPAEQAALNHFCGAITNTPAWLVQPPLLVHSESGLQDKANDLVQAAVNYIRGRGVVGRIDTDPTKVNKKFRWPWTAHKTAAVVRITVQSVNEMVKDWQSDYVVTAHEFGHCIGIPDEYLDYSAFSNATIKNSQPLWDTLCTNYGAPQRNWHDQYNDSMMSIGRTIYKAHGVTICHALDTMTQGGPNNMGARSWTVVGP